MVILLYINRLNTQRKVSDGHYRKTNKLKVYMLLRRDTLCYKATEKLRDEKRLCANNYQKKKKASKYVVNLKICI